MDNLQDEGEDNDGNQRVGDVIGNIGEELDIEFDNEIQNNLQKNNHRGAPDVEYNEDEDDE